MAVAQPNAEVVGQAPSRRRWEQIADAFYDIADRNVLGGSPGLELRLKLGLLLWFLGQNALDVSELLLELEELFDVLDQVEHDGEPPEEHRGFYELRGWLLDELELGEDLEVVKDPVEEKPKSGRDRCLVYTEPDRSHRNRRVVYPGFP